MPYPLAACHSRVIAPAGSTTPVIPPATGAVLIAGLFNYRPVDNPFGPGVSIEEQASFSFLQDALYPLDWAQVLVNPDIQPPPYLIDSWRDQLALNALNATGSARPQLQITSSVEVTGAGTAAANGTYTYRGMFSGNPVFVLEGQPFDGAKYAINSDGPNNWSIWNAAGDSSLYGSTGVFPWSDVWFQNDGDSPAPTVSVSPNQSGEIQFDGSTQGLAGSAPLYA